MKKFEQSLNTGGSQLITALPRKTSTKNLKTFTRSVDRQGLVRSSGLLMVWSNSTL